ncbi:MAG: di-heme-cytochrome C peroxidase [Lewinella sp.]
MNKIFVLALLLGLFTIACNKEEKDPQKPKPAPPVVVDPSYEDWMYFDQGWSPAERDSFWFTSQGSRIMPYDWFTALEAPAEEVPFFTASRMSQLGYLPVPASEQNPGGLPIGFSMDKDPVTGQSFVGLTCAACHTNVIEHEGKSFLIDGAPTMADFVGFFNDVVVTLQATRDDEPKFDRFAHKVLGDEYDAASVEELKKALTQLAANTALREKEAALPSHYPEGFTSYGRLDAFTNIENAGSVFALDMPGNGNPAIGPVSYPFLWGTHQSDVVQWNGSASNIPRNIGPLVRNTGEVVGVFGGLKITKRDVPPKKGELPLNYTSTADFAGLQALEGFVKTLKSPQWNDPNSNLPAVDPELVAQGEILFGKTCIGCHKFIAAEDQMANYKATMVPIGKIGTDPTTAVIALTNVAATGILKGIPVEIAKGPPMQDTMPAITIPVNGVAGLLAPMVMKMLKENNVDMRSHSRSASHAQDETPETPDPSYKARPLNGIWATAPYLHNGSVPNLWEMLKAPEERTKEFWVGSPKFDAKNVGFVTTEGKSRFKVMHQDKVMPGNSNLGHTPGTNLTDEEKWALIEYLKTL